MIRRRSRNSCWWGCALAWLVWFAGVYQGADVIIHLKNGDRLTGKIEAETAADVTLRAGVLGKVTIPVGEIAKRENVVGPVIAKGITNKVAVTNQLASAPKPVTPAPAPTPAVKPKATKHWNSELQFGLNLRYATRDQREALVIAKTTYSNGRFREILDYNFTYGETEGVLSANRMSGSSKTEWDYTKKVYVFGLAGGSYDEIRKLDRQYEINPGVGYNWLTRSNFVFKTEVGLGYQDQWFTDGREVETYSGRLAGIFTWKIFGKLTADGRAEYFPNVKDLDAYRLRFESTLRYPLTKNLSINVVALDLYDTEAPPRVKNNDLQVRSAVGIKF